ncbi:MAG: hypothetical protein IJ292_04555 [Clostridia bacterium]|nr:hypothetical protein [Clostridia bacterium]
MRTTQINIEMNLYDGDNSKKILVYADADNPYEAACAAFNEMLQALREKGNKLPSFGVSEHH